ncbi:MAG TPA: nicotinate phosphoribosyltransferase [Chloroflexia bacterium]|nr:nicotinate phosphoribosyltransferase [Chloroflexia bacterium]
MKQSDQATAEGILFTDQYQFTMSQVYFRMGLHEQHVQFDHFFRNYPHYGTHQAGYCVNAGLEWLLNWMERGRFRDEDIEYLRGQKSRAGAPIFGDDYLAWLRAHGTFDGLTMRAVPEGRVVHPHAPITVIEGPLAMAQILETSLLNHLNFQILIATKAALVHDSGRGRLLLEFGLRRGQGFGANAGARAALIGGADFTSNVGVSSILGYQPKGTHAHSMVQLFITLGEGELGAFRAYAEVYPDDCLLLVDTVDTLESGVPNAITVFQELRRSGHEPVGIRLDSGDLAYLSIQASKMLDAAGFPNTSIVLSNDLDELVIWQIITQITAEAPRYGVEPDSVMKRLVYGVGTRLITSQGDPALGGVYKLVAVKKGGEWTPAIKISEAPQKTPNPGNKRVWRIYDTRGSATADLMSLDNEDPASMDALELYHPADHSKCRTLNRSGITAIEPLLVDVLKEGRLVYDLPTIEAMREQRIRDVERLDAGVRRLINPHIYHVSLTRKLWDLKQRLIRTVDGEDV